MCADDGEIFVSDSDITADLMMIILLEHIAMERDTLLTETLLLALEMQQGFLLKLYGQKR